jgi:hypothetical protein
MRLSPAEVKGVWRGNHPTTLQENSLDAQMRLPCRVDLDVLTHVWPHLRDKAESDIPNCWAYAREAASEETGLPLDMFPATCPWTAALIMHTTFWPMGCDDMRPIWPADDDLLS